MSTHERLAALSAAGVSIWLDDLSRERLRSGNLTELIENWNVVGVTTNPTIFASALSHGDAYDQQVRELARRGADIASAIREITVADVRQACDVFSDTWKATDGLDGRVSLEVDPTLARDTDATVAEACDLWKAVDRPNLLVKTSNFPGCALARTPRPRAPTWSKTASMSTPARAPPPSASSSSTHR